MSAEEARSSSIRYITSITFPYKQNVTAGIREAFRDNFQELLTRKPVLSSSHFDNHLVDFPTLRRSGWVLVSHYGVRYILCSKAGWPGQNSKIRCYPYEMYLRQSPFFVPLLILVYNNWMKQGSIPQRLPSGMIKLLRKNNKYRENNVRYRPLTMLNTVLKILAKVLAVRLYAVLPSLIGPNRRLLSRAGLFRATFI